MKITTLSLVALLSLVTTSTAQDDVSIASTVGAQVSSACEQRISDCFEQVSGTEYCWYAESERLESCLRRQPGCTPEEYKLTVEFTCRCHGEMTTLSELAAIISDQDDDCGQHIQRCIFAAPSHPQLLRQYCEVITSCQAGNNSAPCADDVYVEDLACLASHVAIVVSASVSLNCTLKIDSCYQQVGGDDHCVTATSGEGKACFTEQPGGCTPDDYKLVVGVACMSDEETNATKELEAKLGGLNGDCKDDVQLYVSDAGVPVFLKQYCDLMKLKKDCLTSSTSFESGDYERLMSLACAGANTSYNILLLLTFCVLSMAVTQTCVLSGF